MSPTDTARPSAPADPRQRHFAVQSLLALVLYGGYAAITLCGSAAGLLPLAHALWLAGLMVGGGLVCFAVVVSGASRRLADPSFTLPQCLWGVSCTCMGYLLYPAARGAVLTLLLMVLAFGMFSLTARQSRALSLYAAGLLVGVTGITAALDPVRFPPALQLTHMAMGAAAIWGMAVLSVRMAGLRAHLRQQKAELRQALERNHRLATRDELTGLHNRRHMRELLQQAHGGGRAMSLALIDIDFFKRINDVHGHAAGDRVLAAFSQAARTALREGDVVARWGGEEFLLMLPATPLVAAEAVLQRLRKQVAALPLQNIAHGARLSFSAGLVVVTGAETLDMAIERADRLMYLAKQAGRDQVIVQPESTAVL